MELGVIAQWIAFAVLAAIAIGGALGMTTTMSMFRSGLFLMASFFGVAGLFILLLADLLSFVQVMMYIGGMLVMILFMVLFSGDPGGAMMTGMMQLKGFEKLFSAGLPKLGHGDAQQTHAGDHGGGEDASGSEQHAHDGGMDMDMDMFTPAKKPAMVVAAVVGGMLGTSIVLRPTWPAAPVAPDPESARRIGHLLMGKYMIAFEGAGLLILLGIFGAVFLARPGAHVDPTRRDRLKAAVAEDPPATDWEPMARTGSDPGVHRRERRP